MMQLEALIGSNVLLFVMVSTAQSAAIENGLKGDPLLQCLSESMVINFKTENEFEGHVYVKGYYNDNHCRVDATLRNHVSLTIPYSMCDVRRQRSISPKGLYAYVTVIITFHPMFLTKVDKSFHVKCFYTETDRTVTTRLDVSLSIEQQKKIIVMIGDEKQSLKALSSKNDSADFGDGSGMYNEVITRQIPLPTCRYQVLLDGPQGTPVKYTVVGQQVYHQWSCTYEDDSISANNLYCSTVHSCVVKEQSGREVQLLDENGCALDSYLLDNLEYTSELVGGQHSQVFKFADQSSMYFHCQIRLSLIRDGCKRTSDECTSKSRIKRGLRAVKPRRNIDENSSVVDVFSQSMTVLDIDDDDQFNPNSLEQFDVAELKPMMCLSPASFSLLVAIFFAELFICTISVTLLCRRSQKFDNFQMH